MLSFTFFLKSLKLMGFVFMKQKSFLAYLIYFSLNVFLKAVHLGVLPVLQKVLFFPLFSRTPAMKICVWQSNAVSMSLTKASPFRCTVGLPVSFFYSSLKGHPYKQLLCSYTLLYVIALLIFSHWSLCYDTLQIKVLLGFSLYCLLKTTY